MDLRFVIASNHSTTRSHDIQFERLIKLSLIINWLRKKKLHVPLFTAIFEEKETQLATLDGLLNGWWRDSSW